MPLFPANFVDELKSHLDIVQIVGERVPLRKAGGASWKGLCPFHSEKTPSFHVNPEKGFFHCFGCGVGGNVFKFLELHEKIGFPDAVRMLAQKAGMTIPDAVDGSREDGYDARTRETLLKGFVYDRMPLADGQSVRSGERVEVVLTLESKNDFEYLMFEDNKPAGLEAVELKSGGPCFAREIKSGEVERHFPGGAAIANAPDERDWLRFGVHVECAHTSRCILICSSCTNCSGERPIACR